MKPGANAAKSDFSIGPVWRQILSQAVPLTIAEIVQLLYNVVDRVYLGHLSASDSLALTGVGLVFPIISIVSAFTSLFGSGGAPLFAIARGAGEEEKAARLENMVFALLLGTSIVMMAAVYGFMRPILFLFGASEASWPYAADYMRIYMLGTPFTMLATGLNGFINAQGSPRVGMGTILLGAGMNLLLDPLFIFVLNMGIAGAAWATVISQAVSCLWVLRFLTGKKALFPLRVRHMRISLPLLKSILSLGIVGFIMKGTNALVQAACNSTLQVWGGELYVGVMTVVNSVRDILFLPVSGITGGAQPVMSYNYGAKKPQRVRQGIIFTTALTVGYTLISWLAVLLFPGMFMSIFTNDPETLSVGAGVLRIYFFGFFFQAFQSAGQSVFQSLGDAKHAIFFSLLRKAVIVTPLALLLPGLGFGVNGVFIAEPVSNVVGGLACYITMLLTVYKKKLSGPNPEQ